MSKEKFRYSMIYNDIKNDILNDVYKGGMTEQYVLQQMKSKGVS